MALAQRLGRTLILIGMLVTMAGAGWLLGLVASYGTGLSLWALSPAVLLTGLGMGACFGTIYDIALGDIAPDEAGSASGSLTAIQQLANGIGSAVVTTVYFHSGGPAGTSGHAMAVSVIVVLAITAACLPALRLLPRKAPAEPAGVTGGPPWCARARSSFCHGYSMRTWWACLSVSMSVRATRRKSPTLTWLSSSWPLYILPKTMRETRVSMARASGLFSVRDAASTASQMARMAVSRDCGFTPG